MKPELCVFFQAPAELPYVIQLYDRYKDKAGITIVVVNVYANYEFIKSLNLIGVTVHFCKWPPIKRNMVLSIPSLRKYIRDFWNSKLSQISKADVFFFSASFDWITAFFVKKFTQKENVTVHYAGFNTTEILLQEGYDDGLLNKGIGIKNYILLLSLFLVTGIWFDYLTKVPCISFPYFKYGIKKEQIALDVSSIAPYKYEVPSIDGQCVLLFTTSWDSEGEEIKMNVDNRICEIIKELQSVGYKVVAKGHPRLGMATNIEQSVDSVLPSYVPAEFISINNIKMIIGLNSAAIIHYAKHSEIKVVSLLKMIEGINADMVEDSTALLKKMCGDKMHFPSSSEELISFI